MGDKKKAVQGMEEMAAASGCQSWALGRKQTSSQGEPEAPLGLLASLPQSRGWEVQAAIEERSKGEKGKNCSHQGGVIIWSVSHLDCDKPLRAGLFCFSGF